MEETPQVPWALTPESLAKVQKAPPEPPEPSREDDEPREPFVDLRRATWRQLLIAAALGLAATLAVMASYKGFGHSWDEAYYYAPAQMTVEWLGNFLSDPREATAPAVIERYWKGESFPGTNHPVGIVELPSVVKWLMGLSWGLTRSYWGDQRALRFPAALAFGCSIFLVYILTLNSYRPRAALIAAVAFMTMPRVFGHAHIGATETITNAVLLVSIYCFFLGLRYWWGAVLFGIVFGIALDTKVNALMLAPVLLMWGHIFHRRSYGNNFFAMVFLSPLVWIALWPWLWHDTIIKMFNYMAFFLGHPKTRVFYLGEMWGGMSRPNAPWHYPTVMTLVTVPIPVLVFAICGIARTAVHCRWEYRGILFTMYAFVVLIQASLPGAPKYDGTRLFFSLFPMLAILAGGGADSLVQIFPWNRLIRREFNVRQAVAAVFLALVAGNGLFAILYYHPHELSYFNFFAGGLRGARDQYETTYWGEALNENVLVYINTLPPNANVHALAMHGLALEHLQEWGQLRKDLRIDQPGPVDAFLLQWRRGMFGPEEYAFAESRPAWVYAFRGVPFFSVYRRQNVEPASPAPSPPAGVRAEGAAQP
jgi:hypothetical protein